MLSIEADSDIKSKPPYAGFVLTFEPARTQWLADRIYPGTEVTESFSALDSKFERKELVLLALSRNPLAIFAIALMERMHGSGGSGKRKMRMSEMVVFDDPITESDLATGDLSASVCTPETLKRTSPTDWQALIVELRQLRPTYAGAIDRLIALRETEHRLFGQSQRVARLNEQRDALGLTLEIAQLNRAPVLKAIKVENSPNANSILDLLDHIPVQERSMLEHDSRIFQLLLGDEPAHSAVFSDRTTRSVRVYIVDQTDLETVLGIDLIIYSTCYENFLLLQYKKMAKGGEGWAYQVRPTSNLHDQLRSMASFRSVAKAAPIASPTVWSYRLNEDPFYFKFCEQVRADARDESLVPGLTLCEPHLRQFLSLPEAQGPRGGVSVGYHNCPRYLNNTEFISLAKVGWIGAGVQAMAFMKQVLEANKKGGRAAMLSIIDTPKTASASSRVRKK